MSKFCKVFVTVALLAGNSFSIGSGGVGGTAGNYLSGESGNSAQTYGLP